MVPASFANFFLALAGAGAALIGLLFVAISISPERIFGAGALRERQGVATSAFSALVNGFFVSTGALLPHTNAGVLALIFGGIGLLNALDLGVRLLRYHLRQMSAHGRSPLLWSRLVRSQFMVVGTLVLFGYEAAMAFTLVRHPSDLDALYELCAALVAVYGVALVRAWELLGAPRSGLLGWFNPLADLEEIEASTAPETAATHAGIDTIARES